MAVIIPLALQKAKLRMCLRGGPRHAPLPALGKIVHAEVVDGIPTAQQEVVLVLVQDREVIGISGIAAELVRYLSSLV